MSLKYASGFSFGMANLVAVAFTLAGCEETGTIPPADAGTDSGVTRQITYTPSGCDYTVTTPLVNSSAMHADAAGTTPAPDHIHVSWAGPSHSTFAVNWHTGYDTMLSQVLYGTDEAAVTSADGAGASVTVQDGHSMVYGSDLSFRIHEAHVCGLAAGTRYFYKVGGAGHWSEVFDVATAPAVGATESFTFAVSGDSRNEPSVWADTQKAINTHAVDFQVFSGDAVVLGPLQAEWNAFFEAASGDVSVQDVLARTPFMLANGNHDGLATNYLAQFALPQDQSAGEGGEGEEWYSFDYGNAHFVVLNDTTTGATLSGAETDWIRADFAAVNRATTPWLFVIHHIPPYTCATAHSPDLNIRAAWQPLYDEARVDFVFNGHNHNYERSKPIRGFAAGGTEGQIQATGTAGIPVNNSGTVYVVAAGAGAPLYGVDPSTTSYTQIAESVRNYVIIQIEGNTMHYTAYRLDGTVLDQFDYTKE